MIASVFSTSISPPFFATSLRSSFYLVFPPLFFCFLSSFSLFLLSSPLPLSLLLSLLFSLSLCLTIFLFQSISLTLCLLFFPPLSQDSLNGVDLLVSTPLRLLALIHSGEIDLSKIEIVVLDEADKLFELEAPGDQLWCGVVCCDLTSCNIMFCGVMPYHAM